MVAQKRGIDKRPLPKPTARGLKGGVLGLRPAPTFLKAGPLSTGMIEGVELSPADDVLE